MSILRLGLSVAVFGICAGGYLGSLAYAIQGRGEEWTIRVSQPSFQALAVVFVLSAALLAFFPDKERE